MCHAQTKGPHVKEGRKEPHVKEGRKEGSTEGRKDGAVRIILLIHYTLRAMCKFL
jgi:hypothetical protein